MRRFLPSSDASWALAIVVVLLLCQLPTLTLMPGPNHDEAALNAAAASRAAGGPSALTLLAGTGLTYSHAYYWHPPGHEWVMTAVYRLAGFSIGSTRGVSLAYGAAAALAFFAVLRRLAVARPAAAVVTAAFLLHPQTWWLCRSGRMDLAAIALGLLALRIWLGRETGRPGAPRALAAGMCLGAAGMFHLMILTWGPALIAAETARTKRVPWASAIVCGLAAAAPVATWIAWAFIRGDGTAWLEQFWQYQLVQRSTHGPLLVQPWRELAQLTGTFAWVPLLALGLAAGVIAGLLRTSPARAWCAGGAAVAFALIAFGTAKGTGAYPLYWQIWALLLAGAGLGTLQTSRWKIVAGLALANAVAWQGALGAVAWHQRAARDPERMARFFAQHVAPGAIVAGPEDVWYAIAGAARAHLRIWERPDARRHDYVVASPDLDARHPPARDFHLVAVLPDEMPLVAGRYFSHTRFAYSLWQSDLRPPPAPRAP